MAEQAPQSRRREGNSNPIGPSQFDHDFSRIPIHAPTRGASEEEGTLPSTVLSKAGQHLSPSVRAFAGNRFGYDFSKVKVHTDEHAAESARSLKALAYAKGNHIVFGQGRYAPETPAGLRLLSHELSHVVQQQRSGGATRPSSSAHNDTYERQAGAAADAFLRGGNLATLLDGGSSAGCPALQRQTPGMAPPNPQSAPAPAAPPPPLDYDRAAHPLGLLPKGHTVATMTKALNDKVTAGDITSFSSQGFTAGGNAEIFALGVIFQLGRKTRWGTEADLVTAIDWPAKPGDPAPQGRITLRIDTKGAAVAELIGAGPIPAVAQFTVADGTTKLIADYGVAAVKDDGTASWSDAEISDVIAAFALLPGADKPALKGVELIRVDTLRNARGSPPGFITSGEFSTGGGVAQGATRVTSKPSLKLASEAFPKDQIQFYGGSKGTVPASFQTILHEVGHAVEKQVNRAASEETDNAVVAVNTAVIPLNAKVNERKRLFEQYQASKDPTAKEALRVKIAALDVQTHSLRAEYDRTVATSRKKKADAEKTKVSAATIQPMAADATAKKTSAATELTGAKTAVAALAADEVSSSAAFVKAVEECAAAVTVFAADATAARISIGTLEDAVLDKQTARDQAHDALSKSAPGHKALALLDHAVAAQDAWLEAERVLAHARGRTLRLQKFIDLVDKNNIQRFTKYSKDNWKLGPEEFYAEAYSLWLADPQFLESNYKVVYDFFENGDHRK